MKIVMKLFICFMKL